MTVCVGGDGGRRYSYLVVVVGGCAALLGLQGDEVSWEWQPLT